MMFAIYKFISRLEYRPMLMPKEDIQHIDILTDPFENCVYCNKISMKGCADPK